MLYFQRLRKNLGCGAGSLKIDSVNIIWGRGIYVFSVIGGIAKRIPAEVRYCVARWQSDLYRGCLRHNLLLQLEVI